MTFIFGIRTKDDYASFDKLVLKIDELSPGNHKYLFDSLSLNHPFIKYELYDYLDNVQKMFGNTEPTLLEIRQNPHGLTLSL